MRRLVASHFNNLEDVYCSLDVAVDPKKHVKPIEVRPAQAKVVTSISSDDKYISLSKYSYYESGKKWVKVLLDFPGISKHPKDKVTSDFAKRSFTIKIMDWKGKNYQFSVPKL